MRFKIKNPKPHRVDKTLYRPAEYLTVESLPSGKLDAFETPELQAIPERPLYMVCDCCLTKSDRLWIRRHYGFCTGFPNAGRLRRDYLEGAWGFCVHCWALFAKGETDVLAARVNTLNPETDVDWLRVTYGILREVVHGEARVWESGAKWRDGV